MWFLFDFWFVVKATSGLKIITLAQDVKLNIHVKLYLIKIFGPILNLYYNTDRAKQGYKYIIQCHANTEYENKKRAGNFVLI